MTRRGFFALLLAPLAVALAAKAREPADPLDGHVEINGERIRVRDWMAHGKDELWLAS